MTELIAFSLFDYFPSQQHPTIEPLEEAITNVQEPVTHEMGIRRKDYVYDCGDELQGARKHLVSMAKLSVEWQQAIEDVTVRGMTNSYLVSGTRYGGPYPQGNERESINEAFRIWWNVLNDSGILHDDQLWN